MKLTDGESGILISPNLYWRLTAGINGDLAIVGSGDELSWSNGVVLSNVSYVSSRVFQCGSWGIKITPSLISHPVLYFPCDALEIDLTGVFICIKVSSQKPVTGWSIGSTCSFFDLSSYKSVGFSVKMSFPRVFNPLLLENCVITSTNKIAKTFNNSLNPVRWETSVKTWKMLVAKINFPTRPKIKNWGLSIRSISGFSDLEYELKFQQKTDDSWENDNNNVIEESVSSDEKVIIDLSPSTTFKVTELWSTKTCLNNIPIILSLCNINNRKCVFTTSSEFITINSRIIESNLMIS